MATDSDNTYEAPRTAAEFHYDVLLAEKECLHKEVGRLRDQINEMTHEIKRGHNREIDLTAERDEARNAAIKMFRFSNGYHQAISLRKRWASTWPWLINTAPAKE